MKKQSDGSMAFYFRKDKLFGEVLFYIIVLIFLLYSFFQKKTFIDGIEEIFLAFGLVIFILLIRIKKFFDKEPYVVTSELGLKIKGVDMLPWDDISGTRRRSEKTAKNLLVLTPDCSLVFFSKNEDLTNLKGKAFVMGSSYYVVMDWLSKSDQKTFMKEVEKHVLVSE